MIVLPNLSVALLEIPEVKEALIKTSEEFDSFNTNGLYEHFLSVCDAVEEWKFSPDGDLDNFIPYDNETNGYNPPRIVKRKYKDINEARFLGKYCCGYVAGEHVVTVYPSEKNLDEITISFYKKKSDGIVKVIHLKFRFLSRGDKRVVDLNAVSNIITIFNSLKLKAIVGTCEAFTVYLYEFSGENPISVRIFSKGWLSEGKYEFHYDGDGVMYKVTYRDYANIAYSSVIWEKNST